MLIRFQMSELLVACGTVLMLQNEMIGAAILLAAGVMGAVLRTSVEWNDRKNNQ